MEMADHFLKILRRRVLRIPIKKCVLNAKIGEEGASRSARIFPNRRSAPDVDGLAWGRFPLTGAGRSARRDPSDAGPAALVACRGRFAVPAPGPLRGLPVRGGL